MRWARRPKDPKVVVVLRMILAAMVPMVKDPLRTSLAVVTTMGKIRTARVPTLVGSLL